MAIITKDADPRQWTLKELSEMPITEWQNLKKWHLKRFDQVCEYSHDTSLPDPDHEAWKQEQTELAKQDAGIHDAFFDDLCAKRG